MRRTVRKAARWLARLASDEPYFASRDVEIGRYVEFGKNVSIESARVRIGDGTVIGDNVTISSDVFEIGDYGTIYRDCQFLGPPGEIRIGHNVWIGQGAIIDGHGGTTIGNNVCIGVRSQLWAHMIFGDVMYGCRFHSAKPLLIEDDVWFASQCLVSPIRAGARSLAMLGSVVTRDMEADRVYAGVPATDLTEKFGPQFEPTTLDQRRAYLAKRLADFAKRHGVDDIEGRVLIVSSGEDLKHVAPTITAFNVADRTYTKRGSELEARLIRFLLPDAKFVPRR